MKVWTKSGAIGLLAVGGLLVSATTWARDREYVVTITNVTRAGGQQFTPILVATHTDSVDLFTLGSAASPQLATLAEEGDTGPLAALLRGSPEVRDVVTGSSLLNPGASIRFTVQAGGRFDHFSVAAMLIPTNDAFFAVNSVELPRGNDTLELFSVAYDAGSEQNDQLCASIPGPLFPECGGPGGGGHPGNGEGFVHIHSGIQMRGDLRPFPRDWRNPVAKITIRRLGG